MVFIALFFSLCFSVDTTPELPDLIPFSERFKYGLRQPSTDMRIINGYDAKLGQIPHQVSLQKNEDNSHFCGGTIISNEWIVTAAHCIRGKNLSEIQVVAGTVNLKSGGTYHNVVEGQWDSKYNAGGLFRYDYAVVRVEPPFKFSTSIQSIPLGSGEPAGLPCYASGWGLVSFYKTPENLQTTKLTALCDSSCKSVFSWIEFEAQLCTMEFGTNVCMGDSGGPLTCIKNGQKQLYGIASFAAGGCSWNYPAGWADTASTYGCYWIRKACNNCF